MRRYMRRETSGWVVEGKELVNIDTNERYPIDDIDRSTLGTTAGNEVEVTTIWFKDSLGVGHAVSMLEGAPPGEPTSEPSAGLPGTDQGPGGETDIANAPDETGDSAVSSLDTEIGGGAGGADTDPSPGSETAARETSSPERLLHNYEGTREPTRRTPWRRLPDRLRLRAAADARRGRGDPRLQRRAQPATAQGGDQHGRRYGR